MFGIHAQVCLMIFLDEAGHIQSIRCHQLYSTCIILDLVLVKQMLPVPALYTK